MPQTYQDPIKKRNLEANTPAPADYQMAASPVDQYVAPAKSNNALRLADALSGLNQNLKPMVQDRLKKAVEDEQAKGKLGYLKGDSPEGQSDSYVDGYMALKWEDFGRQAALKINDAYAQAKEDPDLDIRGLVSKFVNEDLQGIQEDPRAIDAYLAQVIPLTESLGLDFQKHHAAIRDAETERMLMVRAEDMVANAQSPEVLRQMMDNEYDTWMAMGKSKADVSAALVDTIIRQAVGTEDPRLLDVLYMKSGREDGIPLATIKGVDEKAKSTREGILKMQKERLLEETYIARQMDGTAFTQTLLQNPFSEELNLENLMPHAWKETGFLYGEGKLEDAWAKVLKARAEITEGEEIGKFLMANQDSMTWRRMSEDPKMKKWYHEQTKSIFDMIDQNDPNSIADGVNRLMEMHRLSGIPPRELVGIFGNLKTSSVDEATGTVAPEVVLALQVYRMAKDRGELAMVDAYAGEEGMAFLSTIDDRIAQAPLNNQMAAEAVRSVKRADSDPIIKQNLATVRSKAFSENLQKEVLDAVDGIMWIGAMDKNVSMVQGKAQMLAEQYVSEYKMTPENAAKAAIKRVQLIYANDGHGAAFELDPMHIADREVLEKGMKVYLDEKKREFAITNPGEEMDAYTIFPNRDGRTYTLFDGKNALPADTIEFEKLKALAHPVGYGTPMQRAENAEVLRTLNGMKFTEGLPPEQAQFLMDNEQAVIRLLASNDMGLSQKMLVRSKLEAARMKQALSVRGEAKEVMDMTRHGNVLNDTKHPLSFNLPAKMAPGTPHNVGELAKQFYGTNPGAALAIIGEGYSPRVYKDQGGMAIGLGYNISTKSSDQVRKDFRAAGVPPQDIDSVLEGRRELTPQQAVKLFENSNKKYEETAKKAYGPGYDKLPKEVKAVLFDMAYNAGSPGKFPTVLNLFRQGKYEEAAKNLTLKYKDENGNWKNNERRVQLWREMLSGDFVRIMDRYSGKRKAK